MTVCIQCVQNPQRRWTDVQQLVHLTIVIAENMKDEDGCLSDNEKIKRDFHRAIQIVVKGLFTVLGHAENLAYLQRDALQEFRSSDAENSEVEIPEVLVTTVISDLDFQRPGMCRRDAGVFAFEQRTYSLLVEFRHLYRHLSQIVTAENLSGLPHSYCMQ